ncbi:sigma 54-interacting transcriptional regulator [Oscillibacter sp.]|uniref:sigma 54-interacting transcriptional regulator n=1 Tax=Oscillibacter sp. TaxID=1945593 RepID=UPI00261BB72F|nr:sigma 54-interacting transcriptional regulator [Oscillibacter sp.]MDD3347388.1 sigma 54-interacting transcriptional regulator [Oscillibacter sp.]
MVNVLLIVPDPTMIQSVEARLQNFRHSEVHIDVTHYFGTPDALGQMANYDVIVARGITYRKLCALYPDKHITNLNFDGTDILEALVHCRDAYHPSSIGLCIKRDELYALLPALEELSHAKISLYEVVDEPSAYSAVDACQRDGMEVVVSGGTVGNICRARSIPYTYIDIRMETMERALEEALKAARSINTERTKSNIIRMILDSSEDAVLAVDETGRILEANGQAYRLYQLAFLQQWQGRPVREINPALTFIGNETPPCRDGEESILNLNGEKYYVKYKLISGEASGIGTLITTSAAAKIMQEERQLRKSLVRKGLTAKYCFRDIIAASDEMKKLVDIAKQFSQANSNVLITGETGTGKELFAHSIHAASRRMNQPFVAINCATLPEALLESELFGYEPGAFSGASREGKPGLFELAHRGTIFLDEIGEIPVALQAKLLRVLQEKEIRRVGSTAVIPVDVRVIAATNVNIQSQIAQGRFRSDLLYRLNALEISISPLRERRDDILPLIEHQLRIFAAEQGKMPPLLNPAAQQILRSYAWPGNVRELRNVCERLAVLYTSAVIDASTLAEMHLCFSAVSRADAGESVPLSAPDSAPLYGIPVFKKKKDVAQELGISRTTLWRMTKRQEAGQARNIPQSGDTTQSQE